ncbi:uncharacterized protein LOC127279636 isoform X2 [Leptopilina boulardi]|nr:uncharacterized protein LOC127279636 isoform X2 [Leptopilina boulardi]XP_051158073.1 uncharacterized protein LOC127279636 isoform X2 [Leptopilina boulardi]
MLGNYLTIRMEKDKHKRKKKDNQWEPICDCDIVEIKRPTRKEGPKIVNAGDNNQILFRIHSKNHLNLKDESNYKPQAIAYKIGPANGGENGSSNCKTITVHPQLGGIGAQEVFNDHVTEGNQDIFLLRVKKKDDTFNQAKRNIEVELRTPKPPTPPPPSPPRTPSPPKELSSQIEEKPPVEEKSKKTKKVSKKNNRKKKK